MKENRANRFLKQKKPRCQRLKQERKKLNFTKAEENMAISAKLVKELREKTGSGMMD